MDPQTAAICRAIVTDGYMRLESVDARRLLGCVSPLTDWREFAASWKDLALDAYMADGGRYRRRRYAVYTATREGGIVRAPHAAHYQSRDYNSLNGGIARWFEPIDERVGSGPTMTAMLGWSRRVFEAVAGRSAWHVEVHQFRIEAQASNAGLPTPEGVHRDGVDYVMVVLVNRQNVASGTTSVHALDGRVLGSFTLEQPLDAVLLDDQVVPLLRRRPPVREAEPLVERERGAEVAAREEREGSVHARDSTCGGAVGRGRGRARTATRRRSRARGRRRGRRS